jgi:hypothetical protein
MSGEIKKAERVCSALLVSRIVLRHLAFQQFPKLLPLPLTRLFFASRYSPPIIQHGPALIAHPAIIFAAVIGNPCSVTSRKGPAVCQSPSIHAASSVNAASPVNTAPPVLSAAPLRDVLCVGETPPLEADAPSATVAQVVG